MRVLRRRRLPKSNMRAHLCRGARAARFAFLLIYRSRLPPPAILSIFMMRFLAVAYHAWKFWRHLIAEGCSLNFPIRRRRYGISAFSLLRATRQLFTASIWQASEDLYNTCWRDLPLARPMPPRFYWDKFAWRDFCGDISRIRQGRALIFAEGDYRHMIDFFALH